MNRRKFLGRLGIGSVVTVANPLPMLEEMIKHKDEKPVKLKTSIPIHKGNKIKYGGEVEIELIEISRDVNTIEVDGRTFILGETFMGHGRCDAFTMYKMMDCPPGTIFDYGYDNGDLKITGKIKAISGSIAFGIKGAKKQASVTFIFVIDDENKLKVESS